MKLLRNLADFTGGIVAGLTVGFGVALLLAPREGEETRALLSEGADEARHKPREVVDDLQSRVNRAIEEGRQAAADARAELEESAGLRRPRRTEALRAASAAGDGAAEIAPADKKDSADKKSAPNKDAS